jgi:ribonuclease P protein subunit RPR2
MRQDIRRQELTVEYSAFVPGWTSLSANLLSPATTMSKVKLPKSKGIPSKHLHARTTFLYQAATYLTLQTASNRALTDATADDVEAQTHSRGSQTVSPLAVRLCSDLQQVSRKAQLRLSVDLKRTMCKRCNTVLVPGRTATQAVENMSKGGKKPWADVVVLECTTCGGKKRFPVGAKKQAKKATRRAPPKDTTSITSPEDGQQNDSAMQTSTEVDSAG